jgi:hypothetical protein
MPGPGPSVDAPDREVIDPENPPDARSRVRGGHDQLQHLPARRHAQRPGQPAPCPPGQRAPGRPRGSSPTGINALGSVRRAATRSRNQPITRLACDVISCAADIAAGIQASSRAASRCAYPHCSHCAGILPAAASPINLTARDRPALSARVS